MTHEEKLSWIRNASNEELLEQYRTNCKESIFDASTKYGIPFREVQELYRETEKEILRRMSK